jgi:hypothetical protein
VIIISDAITSVYRVMAVWIPVMLVPRSCATVAMDTFITEMSMAMRNWPAHSTASTVPEPDRAGGASGCPVLTGMRAAATVTS